MRAQSGVDYTTCYFVTREYKEDKDAKEMAAGSTKEESCLERVLNRA